MQSACAKPCSRGLWRRESERRRWKQMLREEPGHNKDWKKNIFETVWHNFEKLSQKKIKEVKERTEAEGEKGDEEKRGETLISQLKVKTEVWIWRWTEKRNKKRDTEQQQTRKSNSRSLKPLLKAMFPPVRPIHLSLCWTFQFRNQERLLMLIPPKKRNKKKAKQHC